MSRSSIPSTLRAEVFRRDGGVCQYCRLVQIGQGATFHINHVVPHAKGGRTAIENLVLQCPYCSLHKSDKTDGVDPISGERVNLFHPRQEVWDDHFVIREDARVLGMTPTGRVTEYALAMNDPIPLCARAVQISVGILRASSNS